MQDALLAQPLGAGVRQVAIALLENVQAERRRLEAKDDAHALHDFRVALRRLRSVLGAYDGEVPDLSSHKMRRSLRRISRATNRGRDAEVHLAWLDDQADLRRGRLKPGAEVLRAQLEKSREASGGRLTKRVAEPFDEAARRLWRRLAVEPTPPADAPPTVEVSFAAGSAVVVAALTARLREHLNAVLGPADGKHAHDARIAAKHLRYVLEPLAGMVVGVEGAIASLRSLQDALGALHDAQVFGTEIGDAMAKTAADDARRTVSAILGPDPPPPGTRRRRRKDPRPGLIAIATRLRERVSACFAELESQWLGAPSGPFFACLETIVARLASAPGA